MFFIPHKASIRHRPELITNYKAKKTNISVKSLIFYVFSSFLGLYVYYMNYTFAQMSK